MNKLIIIAVFFGLLISSEVVLTAVIAQDYGISLTDTVLDGESESDGEEKSEDNNKIEILVLKSTEKETAFSKIYTHPRKFIVSIPYLACATPPPEV